MKFEVGQKLFYVPNDRRHDSRYVEITKVGRKWLHCSGFMKVDAEDLCTESWPQGKCYLSEEDYNTAKVIQKAWDSFQRKIDRMYTRPEGITLEDIQYMKNLCGIKEGSD